MKKEPSILVLCGAISPEREVSLRSGAACAAALAESELDVELHGLETNALPDYLDPLAHVIFPVIHGDYGEDGAIQAELEAGGFSFAGCDALASRLCIDKVRTKRTLREAGLPVAAEVAFSAEKKPEAAVLLKQLGEEEIVIKPADKGSSVGLHLVRGVEEVVAALALVDSGNWMAEPRLRGREMTIGVLNGEPLGIVEIVPRTGVYDYQNKYTAGATEYLFPAQVAESVAERVRLAARRAFAVCGCRDFARLDFILQPDGRFHFLEINTMPGMTATSLFPKSASCCGVDFPMLTRLMVSPALQRYHVRHS